MHWPFNDIRYSPPDASSNVNYFFVADVMCGLYEINKNNRATATHGPSPVQNIFRDRTKAMLDRRGPGSGPGPVLTLTQTVHLRLVVKLIVVFPVSDSRTFFGRCYG